MLIILVISEYNQLRRLWIEDSGEKWTGVKIEHPYKSETLGPKRFGAI